MENNGFNKIINNINEQRGNLGEPLIEKLGLKTGKEISLVKRSLSENSAIGVGQKIEGKLTRDVHVGLPIELENSNTSPIKEIKEEQGKYFVKTLTSVYELFLQAKQEGNLEKISELQETIRDIESHMGEQPQSVKDMFQGMKDKFYTTKIIDGKNFMFTELNGDTVLALVQDEKNPNKYKTRIFRFSGSDHQWKILPGDRPDGSGVMKGDEANEMHHYVQSAKLDKRMYKVIDSLPQKFSHYSAYKYLPEPSAKENNFQGKYPEEFEFKEEYQELNNPQWKAFQKYCQSFYKAYERFVMGSDGFQNFTLEGGLYKWTSQSESIQEFKNIKNYLEEVNKKPEYAERLKKASLYFFNNRKDEPELKRIAEVYSQNVGSYVEKCFNAPFPKDMIPDFSITNRLDTYFKPQNGSKDKKEGITVEEYKVENKDGDVLIFAMAYDEKGRVYIDNIYDPRVGMNDYGIPEKITQMGHLVYKPEDYESQARFGVPEKYLGKRTAGGYVDISALWEKIPVIKNFKEELKKRGVLK